jgi:hypothetical protein
MHAKVVRPQDRIERIFAIVGRDNDRNQVTSTPFTLPFEPFCSFSPVFSNARSEPASPKFAIGLSHNFKAAIEGPIWPHLVEASKCFRSLKFFNRSHDKDSTSIIAFNQADKIEDAINSVLWTDEIVLADSKATTERQLVSENRIGAWCALLHRVQLRFFAAWQFRLRASVHDNAESGPILDLREAPGLIDGKRTADHLH